MATMQMTIFEGASQTATGAVLQEEIVTISGTAAPTSVIEGDGRKQVIARIYCDVDAWVTWGTGVTALQDGTEGRMIGANNPEYFRLEAGWSVSVIERV